MNDRSEDINSVSIKDLLKLMGDRRSIRSFSTEPIPEDSLHNILEAPTLGPSGLDKLPFRMIVIQDQDTKQKIRTESERTEQDFYSQSDDDFKKCAVKLGYKPLKPFITEAPVLLLIIADTTKPYWRESTWIAIAYIILAIEAEGLGSLTYTPSNVNCIKEICNVPDHFSPEVVIPIGKPILKPPAKKARMQDKIFYEKFGIEK